MINKKGIILFTAIIIISMLIPKKSNAREIIMNFEGLKLNAYKDSAGVWTIGYGSTYNHDKKRAVIQGDVISIETAKKWLDIDIENFRKGISKYLKRNQNQNQIDALTSFVYNIGETKFASSTLLRYINEGKSKQVVADEFLKWVYADGVKVKGLVNRRDSERKLYLS